MQGTGRSKQRKEAPPISTASCFAPPCLLVCGVGGEGEGEREARERGEKERERERGERETTGYEPFTLHAPYTGLYSGV